MADYNNRDALVKDGCSTVSLQNGAYVVQDLVTTYHPAGETPLQFAYPRNINVDWNIKDGLTTLENLFVRDHTIVDDGQVADVRRTINPQRWQAIIFDYAEDLGERALIRDVQFTKDNVRVQRNQTNPDRFDSNWRYRRTGTVRIASTDVAAGF